MRDKQPMELNVAQIVSVSVVCASECFCVPSSVWSSLTAGSDLIYVSVHSAQHITDTK